MNRPTLNSNHAQNSSEKLALFSELCSNHPHLIREKLLVFKTWMRIGGGLKVPYLEPTLDECIEWFYSKV